MSDGGLGHREVGAVPRNVARSSDNTGIVLSGWLVPVMLTTGPKASHVGWSSASRPRTRLRSTKDVAVSVHRSSMRTARVTSELGLLDTNGILRQPWIKPERTSAGLGWDNQYLSVQRERPYRESFAAAGTHLVILHRDGPVTVRRGRGKLSRSRQAAPRCSAPRLSCTMLVIASPRAARASTIFLETTIIAPAASPSWTATQKSDAGATTAPCRRCSWTAWWQTISPRRTIRIFSGCKTERRGRSRVEFRKHRTTNIEH